MTNRWAKQHVDGTRDQIIGLLRELGEGWTHLGHDDRAQAAADAIAGIQAGSFAVKVGHTTYNIKDSS